MEKEKQMEQLAKTGLTGKWPSVCMCLFVPLFARIKTIVQMCTTASMSWCDSYGVHWALAYSWFLSISPNFNSPNLKSPNSKSPYPELPNPNPRIGIWRNVVQRFGIWRIEIWPLFGEMEFDELEGHHIVACELHKRVTELMNVAFVTANTACLANWPVHNCHSTLHHSVHFSTQGNIWRYCKLRDCSQALCGR